MLKKISLTILLPCLLVACTKKSENSAAVKPTADLNVHVQLNNSYCKSDNLPFFIALQKNLFQKNGISISYDQSKIDEETKAHYYSKKADKYFDVLVTGRATIYQLAVANPNSYKIFAGQYLSESVPNYAILVHKHSNISKLSHLSGKIVALEKHSGAARRELMQLILKKHNTSLRNIKFFDLSLGRLNNEKFAALYIREPELTAALATGKFKILQKEPIAQFIHNPWPMGYAALSNTFLQENPIASQKIIQIWNQAIDTLRAEPELVKTIQTECMEKHYQLRSSTDVLAFWKLDEIPRDLVQWQVNLYHRLHIIPANVPVKNLFVDDDSYILQAAQSTADYSKGYF